MCPSSVGHEYALGNQNLGNTTMDSHSFNHIQGNKFDDQFSTNTGSPIMKNTTPGGINTNVGGQNYDINYKDDLLTQPNVAQAATHSLENSLRHSQDNMSQLSKQWGAQSQRAHDLSNSLASGQSSTNTIGADDAKNLRHAQELSSQIGASVSGGGKLLGFGVEGKAGLDSSMRDGLDHSLSEYNKVSASLSHSSNQSIRDAFSETSSLTDSTSNTVQEAASKAKALNDIKSEQSSINSNFSNDFANYLRDRGYSPKDMTVMEQTAQAQNFVNDVINPKYGIQNNLDTPSNSLSSHKFAAPKIDAAGLQHPDNSITRNSVSSNRGEVQAAIDNFKEHQGDIIGNQVVDQGKSAFHMSRDTMDGVENLATHGYEKLKESIGAK